MHSHKVVLCTRCDVMSAMLTGGFAESQSNEVREINFFILFYCKYARTQVFTKR